MNPVATKQVALDNALVPLEKRLKIEKCNARIEFSKPQREETYQTIQKIKDTDAYRFKLDKKKFRVDTEVFREILHIFPRLLNQDFNEPPFEEELVPFIQEIGYSDKRDMLSAIHIDQMHQPWRIFAAIINRCISGKTTGLDRLRESRAQILWGMYNKKNVDFVALLWEDFMFQAGNREITSARKEHMPNPRFTKVIINHFIFKEKTISMRNMINQHTIRDDTLLDIKDSKAYKNYLDFATGKATPKKARKFKKVASPSRKLSLVLEEELVEKPKRAKKPAKKSTTVPTVGVVIRDIASESVLKKKTSAKVVRGKGMDLLSDVALLEAAQLKKTLKKSKLETHKLHVSGSSDGVGVPDVPKYLSESENKYWGDSGDDDSNNDDSDKVTKDDDDDDVDSDADGDKEASDSEKTDSDEDKNPNLNQNDDEEEYEEEYGRTPDSFEFTEDDEEYEKLYKDVNVRLKEKEHEEEGKGDEEMTDAGHDDGTHSTTYEQVKDDEHVILTTVHDTQKTEVPLQSSSVSSDFANQFLNLDNVLPTDTEVISMMNVKVRHEEPNTRLHLFSTYMSW
ncbi:hypothetical protein Tco_1253928 [Tanacetum coccineum]